jgi:hypothetical protein
VPPLGCGFTAYKAAMRALDFLVLITGHLLAFASAKLCWNHIAVVSAASSRPVQQEHTLLAVVSDELHLMGEGFRFSFKPPDNADGDTVLLKGVLKKKARPIA